MGSGSCRVQALLSHVQDSRAARPRTLILQAAWNLDPLDALKRKYRFKVPTSLEAELGKRVSFRSTGDAEQNCK